MRPFELGHGGESRKESTWQVPTKTTYQNQLRGERWEFAGIYLLQLEFKNYV